MDQGVTNIIINELSGSDKVLFHAIRTRNYGILSMPEVLIRGWFRL